MASALVFSSARRRASPLFGAFFSPVDLTDHALVKTLAIVSGEVVSSTSDLLIPFQRRNSRSLIRKIKIFSLLFEFFRDSYSSPLPSSASLCFKELYILIHKSKMLLGYCSQSSRLWLILQNLSISGYFHDLNQEISTLLDVFPLKELDLTVDLREQIELLQKQSRRTKLFVDPHDESLRLQLFSFLNEFERGLIPDRTELETVFVDRLGIRNAKTCRTEIEFLEEHIYNREEDVEPTVSILNGFVALARYCRFLLFGFEQENGEEQCSVNLNKSKNNLICQEDDDENLVPIPKDFCCPISMDLMQDPVITSTGQTYDRSSITRWMEEGHYTCPKSGQMLLHTRLVPNLALRSLISQWCATHGIQFDPPETSNSTKETPAIAASCKASMEANRATSKLLCSELSKGSPNSKTIAARELRLLAKTGKENRVIIAEAGAIPLLQKLLDWKNPVAQENAVTAILNLSIHEGNKSRIMEVEGCLRSIIEVLRHGWTTEARENAAAALFSLSAVHDYKKMITNEEGAVEALAGLLNEGTLRGKRDAVTALYNLSTHVEGCNRIIVAGAVSGLVAALGIDEVAEEAAGALALIVRLGAEAGAEAVGKEESVVAGLMGLMRQGSPRAKENAVAALLEMCKTGGMATTEKVARAPALAWLLHRLLFTGTKRARRKAASLAKMCHSCELAAAGTVAVNLGVDYEALSAVSRRRRSPMGVGEVSVPVSITVPAV